MSGLARGVRYALAAGCVAAGAARGERPAAAYVGPGVCVTCHMPGSSHAFKKPQE